MSRVANIYRADKKQAQTKTNKVYELWEKSGIKAWEYTMEEVIAHKVQQAEENLTMTRIRLMSFISIY